MLCHRENQLFLAADARCYPTPHSFFIPTHIGRNNARGHHLDRTVHGGGSDSHDHHHDTAGGDASGTTALEGVAASAAAAAAGNGVSEDQRSESDTAAAAVEEDQTTAELLSGNNGGGGGGHKNVWQGRKSSAPLSSRGEDSSGGGANSSPVATAATAINPPIAVLGRPNRVDFPGLEDTQFGEGVGGGGAMVACNVLRCHFEKKEVLKARVNFLLYQVCSLFVSGLLAACGGSGRGGDGSWSFDPSD